MNDAASTWVRLPDGTVQAIADQLKAFGWDPEYVTDSEIKMTFPDPGTGRGMRFSEFWLSWRLVDGRLAFGVGDDYGASAGRTRLDWRTRLDIEAGALLWLGRLTGRCTGCGTSTSGTRSASCIRSTCC